jgi:hypothetical protein
MLAKIEYRRVLLLSFRNEPARSCRMAAAQAGLFRIGSAEKRDNQID